MTEFDRSMIVIAVGSASVIVGVGGWLARSFWQKVFVIGFGAMIAAAIGFTASGSASLKAVLVLPALGGLIFCARIVWFGFSKLSIRNRVAGTTVVTGLAMTCFGFQTFESPSMELELQKYERVIELSSQSPVFASQRIHRKTDHGHEIFVKLPEAPRDRMTIVTDEMECLHGHAWGTMVIRTGEASDHCNCHGWVFTKGEGWVAGNDVPAILNENDYWKVETPQPGDLAIYRSETGSCRHTAIVRATGDITMVEGKWGWMGVYLHPSDRSCYGQLIEYYRSAREGHAMLTGPGTSAESKPVLGGAE
jgi:hypothetical protein